MNKAFLAIRIAIVAILVIAVFKMPYNYYIFMRFALFSGFGYMAYQARNNEGIQTTILCGIMAVFFNPFMPFRIAREQWQIADVWIAVCVFAWIIYNVVDYVKKRKALDIAHKELKEFLAENNRNIL